MASTTAEPVVDTVTDRLAKLERSITRLKKKVRRLERTAEPPIEITPELAAEIDRLEEYVKANPDEGVPWEEVMASALARFKK